MMHQRGAVRYARPIPKCGHSQHGHAEPGWRRLVGKSDFGASVRRLNTDLVIHSTLNPLFATEISFRCLNRNVTEQKLDLLQFASGGVAKTCTRSAEIV